MSQVAGRSHTDMVRRVLIVDDDRGTRETIGWGLKADGVRVETAASGAAGLVLALSQRFDLLVLDLRLPDMLGTEVVRSLDRNGGHVPFVLMSGFLSTEVTVEAMKLGAVDVLEKPIDVERLLEVMRAADGDASDRIAPPDRGPRSPPPMWRPRSAAERWAMLVVRACESEGDPRTLEDWASFVGLSYTSLRETCRLVDIRPHDARDLMRVLRALIRSERTRYPPEVLLDISDGRTLKAIFHQAGLELPTHTHQVSVDEFLTSQRFVDAGNAGLCVLRNLLAVTERRRQP